MLFEGERKVALRRSRQRFVGKKILQLWFWEPVLRFFCLTAIWGW